VPALFVAGALCKDESCCRVHPCSLIPGEWHFAVEILYTACNATHQFIAIDLSKASSEPCLAGPHAG
jgi:hypothetical protein